MSWAWPASARGAEARAGAARPLLARVFTKLGVDATDCSCRVASEHRAGGHRVPECMKTLHRVSSETARVATVL
jgi:hypothetical protein